MMSKMRDLCLLIPVIILPTDWTQNQAKNNVRVTQMYSRCDKFTEVQVRDVRTSDC